MRGDLSWLLGVDGGRRFSRRFGRIVGKGVRNGLESRIQVCGRLFSIFGGI